MEKKLDTCKEIIEAADKNILDAVAGIAALHAQKSSTFIENVNSIRHLPWTYNLIEFSLYQSVMLALTRIWDPDNNNRKSNRKSLPRLFNILEKYPQIIEHFLSQAEKEWKGSNAPRDNAKKAYNKACKIYSDAREKGIIKKFKDLRDFRIAHTLDLECEDARIAELEEFLKMTAVAVENLYLLITGVYSDHQDTRETYEKANTYFWDTLELGIKERQKIKAAKLAEIDKKYPTR